MSNSSFLIEKPVLELPLHSLAPLEFKAQRVHAFNQMGLHLHLQCHLSIQAGWEAQETKWGFPWVSKSSSRERDLTTRPLKRHCLCIYLYGSNSLKYVPYDALAICSLTSNTLIQEILEGYKHIIVQEGKAWHISQNSSKIPYLSHSVILLFNKRTDRDMSPLEEVITMTQKKRKKIKSINMTLLRYTGSL